MVKLHSTNYVIYDRANDHILEFAYSGDPIIYGDKTEAMDNCYGNEEVISCTALPTHKQVELLEFLKLTK